MATRVRRKTAPSIDIGAALISTWTDSVDDLRYFLMRLTRLVVALACEIGAILSMIYVMRCLIRGNSLHYQMLEGKYHLLDFAWYFRPIVQHPNLCALGFAILTLVLWSAFFAVTAPYHYQTTKPGLSTKRCWRCRLEIRDAWFCSSCKVFRPGKIATTVLWTGSLLITILQVLKDLLSIFMAGVFARGNG